jgi:hypothetical protein
VLPDGSLLVLRIVQGGAFRLNRYRLGTGQLETLNGCTFNERRSFPDGKQAGKDVAQHILDSKTGMLNRIPVPYEGNLTGTWTADGRIMAVGEAMHSASGKGAAAPTRN